MRCGCTRIGGHRRARHHRDGQDLRQTATDFAADAIALALEDAGLTKADVDGLLINANPCAEMDPKLQMGLGFPDLTLLNAMSAYGSTLGHDAPVRGGGDRARARPSVILLVYADAPAAAGRIGGRVLRQPTAPRRHDRPAERVWLLRRQPRLRHGRPPAHAPVRHHERAVRRHRRRRSAQWALMNEQGADAQAAHARGPPGVARTSPSPCTSSTAASCRTAPSPSSSPRPSGPATCASRPSTCSASGRPRPGDSQRADRDPGRLHRREEVRASRRCGTAGVTLATSTCSSCTTATPTPSSSRSRTTASAPRARAAPFVEDGKLGPGGSLPTNTGGGQLSSFYMWGFTPLSEGVIQARGQGGLRQVPEARPRARQRQRRLPQLPLDDRSCRRTPPPRRRRRRTT